MPGYREPGATRAGPAVSCAALPGGTILRDVHRQRHHARRWITDGGTAPGGIPGLTVQADTFDELADSVFALAPDLLRANTGVPAGTQLAITIIAERRATTMIVA
jgi:hypothetical protein